MKKYVDEIRDYVVGMRRYFHMHPELSFQEYETTKKVAEELDKMGIPYEINNETTDGCGLIAWIDGAKEGKCVGLRADMDALNVQEKNTVDYKSQVDSKMHACGHDAHTAMLLGAAKILKQEQNNLAGKVYLLFQPAEEIGAGAQAMMKFGNWYNEVDNMFGTHVWANLEVGKISVEAGERMAAGDMFRITVHGKSGHGSAPDETVDAVVVASAIVMNLQTLVSRSYSPLDSVVCTVGSFHSGSRFNIIAGEAVLEGTNRYFTKEIGARIEDDMRRVVDNTAAAYGATADLEYNRIVVPTINDEASSELAKKAAVKVMGEDAVVNMRKVTGGEDFSYLIENKPGCFAFLGVKNSEIGADLPHHNECFNIDDSILAEGAAVYAQYAVDFLNQ